MTDKELFIQDFEISYEDTKRMVHALFASPHQL